MFLLAAYFAVLVLLVASNWVVFTKAGEAGWKSIVPIYGLCVLARIVGRPWWWGLLLFVPVVNIVVGVVMSLDLARSFSKGAGFGWGIVLLGPVFYPLLAFGDNRYAGPGGQTPPRMSRAA